MPQVFQVLRCYQCSVFQVHQTKKSNKFGCKLCGAKQSIKRQYGIGTAKDCRLHVQKLNGIRKEIDEVNSTISDSPSDDNETDYIKIPEPQIQKPSKSKWNSYVEKNIEPKPIANDPMYFGNKEVVLEVPKKKPRRQNFKCLNVLPTEGHVCNSIETNENNFPKNKTIVDIARHIDYLSQCSSSDISQPSLHLDSLKNEYEDNRSGEINNSAEKKIDLPPKKASITKLLMAKNLNTVNMSSKWAQFVEEEELLSENDSVNSGDSAFFINTSLSELQNKQVNSHTLFSLVEDNDDLDNILNI